MSITPLENAIALIKQDKYSEAQILLKALITEDQHNITAWFWLIETCKTNNQRLQVLEMCLEYNPNNEQVKQALEKLRTLSPVQLSAVLPKNESKHSPKNPLGEYITLLKLSIGSAVILVALYYLTLILVVRNLQFIFLFAYVIPWIPLLCVPATMIVYSIYSKRHKDVFLIARIGVPFIFNLLAVTLLVGLPWVNSSIHSPAKVSLTGEFSSQIGTSYDQKTLDVTIGITSEKKGDFTLSAQLIASGQIISTSTTNISLVRGDNTVTLHFRGEDIRAYRLDGPYLVKVLPLHDWDGDDIFMGNNTWQTAAYHWRDFGGELCFALQTSLQPATTATIYISPPPNCSNGKYLSATRVTLLVKPKPGYQLKGWGGDMGGVDIHSPIITIQMQRDMIANAFFEPGP